MSLLSRENTETTEEKSFKYLQLGNTLFHSKLLKESVDFFAEAIVWDPTNFKANK